MIFLCNEFVTFHGGKTLQTTLPKENCSSLTRLALNLQTNLYPPMGIFQLQHPAIQFLRSRASQCQTCRVNPIFSSEVLSATAIDSERAQSNIANEESRQQESAGKDFFIGVELELRASRSVRFMRRLRSKRESNGRLSDGKNHCLALGSALMEPGKLGRFGLNHTGQKNRGAESCVYGYGHLHCLRHSRS
jgi:hypothetical protein